MFDSLVIPLFAQLMVRKMHERAFGRVEIQLGAIDRVFRQTFEMMSVWRSMSREWCPIDFLFFYFLFLFLNSRLSKSCVGQCRLARIASKGATSLNAPGNILQDCSAT
jgi:hypothetical protein